MANLKNDDRLRNFSRFVYAHPIYKEALETVKTAISQTITTEGPMSAVLTGLTGTGKSTLITTLMRSYSGKNEYFKSENALIRPVRAYHCVVPADASIKSLATEMLKHLDAGDTSGSANERTLRVSMLLKTCETKVIFLDEFQHLLTKAARNSKDSVTDWVKTLTEETGVPVIISGMPGCEEIIDQHEQLAGRYPYRAKLANIRFAKDNYLYFSKVIEALTKACIEHAEINSMPALSQPPLLSAIYIATGGNMRSIRQLYTSALDRALRNGKDDVILEDFIQAVQGMRLNYRLTDENPFTLSTADQEKILIKVS